MGSRRCSMFRGAYRVGLVAAAAAVFLAATPLLFAQAANRQANQRSGARQSLRTAFQSAALGYYPQPPVGGISIDADGLLSKAAVDVQGKAARRGRRDWRRSPRS